MNITMNIIVLNIMVLNIIVLNIETRSSTINVTINVPEGPGAG